MRTETSIFTPAFIPSSIRKFPCFSLSQVVVGQYSPAAIKVFGGEESSAEHNLKTLERCAFATPSLMLLVTPSCRVCPSDMQVFVLVGMAGTSISLFVPCFNHFNHSLMCKLEPWRLLLEFVRRNDGDQVSLCYLTYTYSILSLSSPPPPPPLPTTTKRFH